jgi:GDP-L-fucose synthase
MVTGGAGFLGSPISSRLEALGADLTVPRSQEWDLRDWERCRLLLENARPQVVIHCAVDGGGIGYMRANPGSVYTNNVRMNTHILQASMESGVEKFVGVSSVCAYPRDAPIPMREEDIWTGYPEPSNAAYGLSKRMMMEQGLAYAQQYGFRAVFPMPVNLYGPGDDFGTERSHVVPALIRKCLEAKEAGRDQVEIWGSGKATRELLYVEDCAEAVVWMAEHLERVEPVNVGTGRETSIRELATLVAEACDFTGELVFDASKPDGQPRKCLDLGRVNEWCDWEAVVALEEGLKRTVDWYLSH